MADYSSLIFNSLDRLGQGFADSRQRREDQARLAAQDALQQRRYSDELMRDQRDFDFRQKQADRGFGLQERTAARLERGAGTRQPPPGYRWTPDGNLEAIPGGPASGGRTANAPPGYRWAADGTSLEAIAGGPAVKQPAELAARVGMAENFLDPNNLDPLKRDIAAGDATGPVDYVLGKIGQGRSGEIRRRLLSGTDALQRMLTGAGMNLAEATQYAERYQPTMTDSAEILTDKVNQLQQELTRISGVTQRGRQTGPVPTPPGAPGAGQPAANDPLGIR